MNSSRIRKQAAGPSLARDHVELAGKIACRLCRSYSWVGIDDLRSYAYLGLALAERAFRPELGVPFVKFAWRKAMFLAIDEMRKDGVVSRKDARRTTCSALPFETADPQSGALLRCVDRTDLYDSLMMGLKDRDHRLVEMYYTDGMTFREIARVFGITESAVCLRHKTLINKLRVLAGLKAA